PGGHQRRAAPRGRRERPGRRRAGSYRRSRCRQQVRRSRRQSRPVFGQVSLAALGELRPADTNGVRLPDGFESRIVAQSGYRVRRSWFSWLDYRWHIFPDGGATYAMDDGGWIYVSNCEAPSFTGGGVSALRFDRRGNIRDAYRILGDTNQNCAGGPTPWGTWLSCEEIPFGRVYECDPTGTNPAVVRRALGYFKHEAAAVDPETGHLYLTEDEGDGRFYRYVPDAIDANGRPNLDSGRLQVARVENLTGVIEWLDVPNPQPNLFQTPTRQQVAESTSFDGGEGIWYANGKVYFTTKGDNRVWCLFLDSQTLTVLYDRDTASNPVLSGVDNVTVAPSGDVLVAEDGGDMQIVVVDENGEAAPLLQIDGQDESEITGPAFSPDGTRLYFSSQRGSRIFGGKGLGLTYEVRGPFSEILGAG
ncbi:MAG: alkaline phosphatase PhoX, partial [Myxococcota bacterium]